MACITVQDEVGTGINFTLSKNEFWKFLAKMPDKVKDTNYFEYSLSFSGTWLTFSGVVEEIKISLTHKEPNVIIKLFLMEVNNENV